MNKNRTFCVSFSKLVLRFVQDRVPSTKFHGGLGYMEWEGGRDEKGGLGGVAGVGAWRRVGQG